MTLDKTELLRIYKGNIAKLQMTLPYDGDNLNVELIRSDLFTEDFSVITSDSKGQSVPVKTGVYFRGVLKNDMNSLVTLSIFENEAIGIISTDNGNIVIGGLNDSKDGEYIIYNDKDLLVPFSFECNTLTYSQIVNWPKTSKLSAHNTTGTRTNKCVRMYLELDYTLVTEKEVYKVLQIGSQQFIIRCRQYLILMEFPLVFRKYLPGPVKIHTITHQHLKP
ncbi:MAG: hypothetical protein IPL55_07775 [Saprospiraceae bacterium]|nr:hypothetical protein [Saprospiraceae bacterium]